MTAGEVAPARGGRKDPADVWRLGDERDFLRRSLDDADREHRAGDLSDEDHTLLVARDTARLADVEADLAAFRPPCATRPSPLDDAAGPIPPDADTASEESGAFEESGRRMPWWRVAGIVAACLCIATGGVILVTHFVQSRQPGQASSGSVTVSQAQTIEQQLNQALDLNNEGNTKAALELYDKVLTEDPSNPAALAYAGYLQWNIGTSAHVASLVRIGRAEISTAVRDAPTYYEAHLFDGLVLENQDHDDAAAVAQFDEFLADGPPAAELPQVAPLVAGAYQRAGTPLPSALSSATATTSTP